MKSYTDLEQSKKLAEILPLESADMFYFLDPTPLGNVYHLTPIQVDFGVKTLPKYNEGDIPCWSLAALLELIMPKGTTPVYVDNAYQMVYDIKPYYITSKFDNLLDAAFEMIVWLKEKNLL